MEELSYQQFHLHLDMWEKGVHALAVAYLSDTGFITGIGMFAKVDCPGIESWMYLAYLLVLLAQLDVS